MSENVQIALVIGAVLIFALWMFKDRLDIFNFSASKKCVSAKMEKHQDTGITISNNTQDGNSNEISTETANVTIEENLQQGDKNRIHAAATSKKK
jgi:hypothetical protein